MIQAGVHFLKDVVYRKCQLDFRNLPMSFGFETLIEKSSLKDCQLFYHPDKSDYWITFS